MNSFVETISPAAKNHIEARLAYVNEMGLAMVETMRSLADVNLQFSRDWLRDSTEAWQSALTSSPSERAEHLPSTEELTHKVQAYQQELVRIATEFQASINQVTQQHAPHTARTASELAEAVTQKAAAQTEQQMRLQKRAGEEFLDQAGQFAQVATQNRAMQQPASMQSDEGQGNKS